MYLERQAKWQKQNIRLQYNEIIVDGDATRRNLPLFVDAFFTTAPEHTSGEVARTQHELFREMSSVHIHRHELFRREFGAAAGISLW